MIDQVNADVMLLQEVGSQVSLEQLNEQLPCPYPYTGLVPGNSNRSIHLAVLSRFEIHLHSHRHTLLSQDSGAPLVFYPNQATAKLKQLAPLVLARDILQIHLQHPRGLPITLFGVHLKSRTNPTWQCLPADTMRAAECRALVAVIDAYQTAHPAEPVVVLGDFNDRLTSEALNALQVLNLEDPLGMVLQSSGRNPSTYWPKRRMRIDHILLNSNAVSLFSVSDPIIHANRMAQTASDHYPVSLVLK